MLATGLWNKNCSAEDMENVKQTKTAVQKKWKMLRLSETLMFPTSNLMYDWTEQTLIERCNKVIKSWNKVQVVILGELVLHVLYCMDVATNQEWSVLLAFDGCQYCFSHGNLFAIWAYKSICWRKSGYVQMIRYAFSLSFMKFRY